MEISNQIPGCVTASVATYCALRTLEAGLNDDREGICHFYSELEKVRGRNSLLIFKRVVIIIFGK